MKTLQERFEEILEQSLEGGMDGTTEVLYNKPQFIRAAVAFIEGEIARAYRQGKMDMAALIPDEV